MVVVVIGVVSLLDVTSLLDVVILLDVVTVQDVRMVTSADARSADRRQSGHQFCLMPSLDAELLGWSCTHIARA